MIKLNARARFLVTGFQAVFFCFLLSFGGECLNASTLGQIQVDARANLYSAGHSYLGGDGSGLLPPSYSFNASPGQDIIFSSITGEVGCNSTLTNGPDGTCFPQYGTSITSDNGLSGIVVQNLNLFLAGVFLDANEPGSAAPARLRYNFGTPDSLTTDDVTFAPAIDQVFFIGDGQTSSGTSQIFQVPDTASRLYFGFADSFDSYPGYYDDNVGSLTVQGDLVSQTPEPATIALVTFALMLIGGYKMRKPF